MLWGALCLGLVGCSSCGTEELSSDGDARLVHVSGYEPGIAVAAPHAPIVLPYLRHHSDVYFERNHERAVVLDVRPEELRGRPMRVEPSGARFALHLESGWALFFVHDGARAVARDPRPLPDAPVWSRAPEWRDRAVDVFRATSEPAAIARLVAMDGSDALAHLVVAALDAPAGERPDGAMEFAHRLADRWVDALERLVELDPSARAPALDALARAYAQPDASEVVLRRARWMLPAERLVVPAPIARSRAARADLDEVERAAALLIAPAQVQEELACELLGELDALPPRLTAAVISRVAPTCGALDAWTDRHACETAVTCDAGEVAADAPAVSPDLRDALTTFPTVASAMSKRCASGRPLDGDLARRRERLRYRLEVRAATPWDLISRSACETAGDELSIDGVVFTIDDDARRIRQRSRS